MAIKKFCSNGFSPFPFWTTISEETGSNGFAIKFERRLKKEKYAEMRKAKLRLSNIKLEEITQILRGKSKWIKH